MNQREKRMSRLWSLASVSLLVLSLAGCANDDIVSVNGQAGGKRIMLAGEIDQVAVTRVNDSGFCTGDGIGVYFVDYNGNIPGQLSLAGNRGNNVRFTFDETAYQWNSDYDIYWKDNQTHIDVYGYYPYGTPSSIDAYAFEVQKDQSTAAGNGALGGYEASDFLWGKAADVAPTANVIRLSFKHRMANVRVTLVEGTGFASGEWAGLDKQALAMNTKRNAVINLSDGSVTATGEVAAAGIIPSKVNNEFRAIVVPQTVAASKSLFTVTVGGVAYKFTKEEAFTYVSGKMHNFSIVVNKKANTGDYEFVLASESITAWENDAVSHDATAREYIVIDVPEAGTLKECITKAGKDYKKLQNLKITGKIDKRDFDMMRVEMDRLQSLNLKETTIQAYGAELENIMPNSCLDHKITLLRIILPDKLEGIGSSSFYGCTNLVGSLTIPEGVKTIGAAAFRECTNMTGTLSLPTTLERIEEQAFYRTGFACELILPSALNYMARQVFTDCPNFYGSLHLPDGLTYMGEAVFENCVGLTGSIEIPAQVKEIGHNTFYFYRGDGNFNGTLILHDGITSIGENAFNGAALRGELVLPKDLVVVGSGAFRGCDFSGELKLPAKLTTIGNDAFAYNWRLMGTLEIPENVQSIGSNAFAYCRSIEKVIFPEATESILSGAFTDCFGIGSIVCKGAVPSYVHATAFNGVAKDNFTVEVPEPAVQQYQVAAGWADFKRISAHRELVCRPAVANAINTRCTRTLVLNAEGDWEVESKPSWCTLSAMNGSKKTELTLTIEAMSHGSAPRTGDVVFKLKGRDYTSRCTVTQHDYEYDEDQIITLQQAKKGKGINLVFLGDGYNAEDISKGTYLAAIREQVEHFFGIEPYTTYRDYFNVYTAIAVSPETGIGTINTIRYTRFETTFTGGVGMRCDYDAAFDYALRMPTVDKNNLKQSLIIITPNTTDYGGICQMWEDGSAIAFCPMSTYGYPFDTRGVLQHEAAGHGFGKLGDEYIYHNAFIDFCPCTCCPHDRELRYYQSLGWFQNLSLTGKMHEVPWSHFIFNDRYSSFVDIFEGGYMHSRGVFRSEQNSCMNNDVPYYSTISREAIVKRIMEYAGETYTLDKFLANDKIESGNVTRAAVTPYWGPRAGDRQAQPQVHKGSPLSKK